MTKPKKKAKPKAAGRRVVTDADIIAELSRNGGQTAKADADLKIRKGRSSAVSQKYGGIAELKKKESAYTAVEQAVISLAAVLELVRPGFDADFIKAVAIAMGVSVDKMLVMVGKASFINRTESHNVNESTSTEAKVDFTDMVNKLTREELEQMLLLRDKLNGVEQPPEQSDLDSPEVYDVDTYQPPPVTPVE